MLNVLCFPHGPRNITRFHCGSTNEERVPGIWIHPTSGDEGGVREGFHVKFSNVEDYNDGPESTAYLTIGETYHIEIDITQSWFQLIVDGQVSYSAPKARHVTYENMKCYASDPWYPAADVTVSNIRIFTGIFPLKFD